MKEVITGAMRYLSGHKKLIVINVALLTSGILIIVFSFLLGRIEYDLPNFNANNSIWQIMILLGFSVFFNLALINSNNYALRIKEFEIRIIFGSGMRKILYQLTVESLVQLAASLICAFVIIDILFTLFKDQHHPQLLLLFSGNLKTMVYIIGSWLIIGIYFTLLQNKRLKKIKPDLLLHTVQDNSCSGIGKFIVILQFTILNLGIFYWLTSIGELIFILHSIILILACFIIAFTFVVRVHYQSKRHKNLSLTGDQNGYLITMESLCREMIFLLVFSSFLSFIYVIIEEAIFFTIGWDLVLGCFKIILFNIFLALSGKKICFSMRRA